MQWHVSKIHVLAVIASREGIKTILESHPNVSITVGTIDGKLTENGKLLPGLGDSGDRRFKTAVVDDEETLLHVSKRKRSVDIEPPSES
jgi:uracil phosphoribosyltransferase